MGPARRTVQHPDSGQIAGAIRALAPVALRAVVYRSAEPRYAKRPALLSGNGSARHGGRWNPKRLRTVYASTTPETAMAEATAVQRRYGFDPVDAFPRVFVAVNVRLTRLIDLTDARTRRALGVSLTTIRTENWRRVNRRHQETRTQAIGRLAAAAKLEGLIVPAVDGGVNVVWFPGRLRRRSRVSVHSIDA